MSNKVRAFLDKQKEFENLEHEYFNHIFDCEMSWTYKLMNIIQNKVYFRKHTGDFIESPNDIFKRLFCNKKYDVLITSNTVSELYFKDNFWNSIGSNVFFAELYLDIIFSRWDDEDEGAGKKPVFIYYHQNVEGAKEMSDNMIAELAMNLIKIHKATVFEYSSTSIH